jgi:nitrite reductase/ring-hydroxylating ferredoxin subunit/DMSO/TMAO reductase YedYZ heme-binding membrane subunit
MSITYGAISWNRQKRIYDTVMVSGVLLYLTVFVVLGLVARPELTVETLLIRALGTCSLVLLHVVLAIGPLCRFDRRFLPLLYNRRHLGVTTFLVALAHAAFATFQFHAFGNVSPFLSLLISNTRYTSIPDFPFESLGILALGILFVMAATSHDFWLANLTAPVWKALHMLVYLAYVLVVGHVGLGALQVETSPLLVVPLACGVALVVGLHVAAAVTEWPRDAEPTRGEDWIEVCRVDEIPHNRARIATVGKERVAVFRYEGKVSAVSNVCQHQNGPLGEGRIVDGCITCPWHGYQYRTETGRAPEPFSEKIPTFQVRIDGEVVFVHRCPNPPGTFVEPAVVAAPVERMR